MQEAYNRSAVVRPLSSLQPVVQHGGRGPHVMQTGVPVTRCGKIAPPLATMPRLLGAVAED
jgi:hypothetical protein